MKGPNPGWSDDDNPFPQQPLENGHDTPQPDPWPVSTLTKWHGQDIPPRPWLMEDWIIRGQVTGFYGIGGIRKTDWLLQLMIATALGQPFCGIPIDQAAVLGLFCEDTDPEIARRAQRLAQFYQTTLAQLTLCHYASLVGTQLTELITYDFNQATPTPAFNQLSQLLETYNPKLLVLDTAPDFFGGSENNRREVAQFIRLLDNAAQHHDCAIIFSAQPSVRGRFSRTLESGTTGWENKVRARLTLHDPQTDDDEDNEQPAAKYPSNRRILTRAKSNYAIPGAEIPLVIKNGGFFPEAIDQDTAPLRGLDREIRCRSLFKEMLEDITRQGRWVNDTRTTPERYAPTVFAKRPRQERLGFLQKDFEKAMSWLLDHGDIKPGTHRHAGRNYNAIILTHKSLADDPAS
jgi:RecA-family ATPase